MSTPASSSKLIVEPVPLTPSAFAPFGTVISSPLSPSTTAIPSTPPPNAIFANQNTALKFADISPLKSTYGTYSDGVLPNPTLNLFSCFPRPLRDDSIFDVRILERHPFTTQSFIPLSTSINEDSTSKSHPKFLIIVAPMHFSPPPPSTPTPYLPHFPGPPDLMNLKAFVVDQPGIGVTYGVGTWHAPMVVLGDKRVDFIVTQWVSGIAKDDCQEVEITEGLEVALKKEEKGQTEKGEAVGNEPWRNEAVRNEIERRMRLGISSQ